MVLAYATNWAALAGVSISPYVTHLWSLAIEEQFYLVWPPLLFGALRLWHSRRRLVVAGRWGSPCWPRPGGWPCTSQATPGCAIYLRTDARADALAIGCLLALLPREQLWAPAARPGAGAGRAGGAGGDRGRRGRAAALRRRPLPGRLHGGGHRRRGPDRQRCWTTESPLTRALASRPAVILGRLSYSLYLWHFGIFQIVATHTTVAGRPLPRVVLAWALALLAAGASYRFVELPALRLKRRPRPAGAVLNRER